MLTRLLQKLKAETPRTDAAADERLAVAVLLHEIARADYDHQPAEQAALRRILIDNFDVAESVVDGLLVQAEQRGKASISLHDFVSTINARLDTDRKRELLSLLWKVAYADGRIDPHEEHLLRRLADLLHLSHADFIRGKLANEN